MQARQDHFQQAFPPLCMVNIRVPNNIDHDARDCAAFDPAQLFQRSYHPRLQFLDEVHRVDLSTRHANFNIEGTVTRRAGSLADV